MRREEHGCDDLREEEEGDEPAPHEEAEVDVVPEGDEGEDDEIIAYRTDFGEVHVAGVAGCFGITPTAATTAKRDVQVADDPAVVGTVPSTPEREGRVVI